MTEFLIETEDVMEKYKLKVNVSGLASKEIRNLINQVSGGQIDVRIVSDIEGAREVAEGKVDYILGACATGGGGALSMAIAILGYSKCFTVSTAGKPPREKEIQDAVANGKKAFGFTSDHVSVAVPLIIKHILANPN